MKAEIGFYRDWSDDKSPTYGQLTDRLELVVQGQSSTEHTMLMTFAKRMGLNYDHSSGKMWIAEPVKPDAASVDAACAQMDKHQVHGAQVPDILPEGEAR